VGSPNTRVQRTRSSASPLRSPLTRCPLGAFGGNGRGRRAGWKASRFTRPKAPVVVRNVAAERARQMGRRVLRAARCSSAAPAAAPRTVGPVSVGGQWVWRVTLERGRRLTRA
jgi:hypothetical protein